MTHDSEPTKEGCASQRVNTATYLQERVRHMNMPLHAILSRVNGDQTRMRSRVMPHAPAEQIKRVAVRPHCCARAGNGSSLFPLPASAPMFLPIGGMGEIRAEGRPKRLTRKSDVGRARDLAAQVPTRRTNEVAELATIGRVVGTACLSHMMEGVCGGRSSTLSGSAAEGMALALHALERRLATADGRRPTWRTTIGGAKGTAAWERRTR
ncbi:hypothetical protein FH972_023645 [Carpinus fangiana]|uniref:Uncharacterized protein n=1 Tax=Carpinus fangiana TaxID=176857 RepID=A0A5N6KW62_9ROSI|nr:hypothetical protein FH972_023645 [Carpinus fangiana]